MWGDSAWGDVTWGDFGSAGHGHAFGAGVAAGKKASQAVIRALMAQQMREILLDKARGQMVVRAGANMVRESILKEMERRLMERDADDWFVVLGV